MNSIGNTTLVLLMMTVPSLVARLTASLAVPILALLLSLAWLLLLLAGVVLALTVMLALLLAWALADLSVGFLLGSLLAGPVLSVPVLLVASMGLLAVFTPHAGHYLLNGVGNTTVIPL